MTVSSGAPRGTGAVALVITILLAAGAAMTWRLAGTGALLPDLGVPFLALVAAFALTETLVLHVQFRREHHTILLTEAPLVVALAALSPQAVVLARTLGGALPAIRRVRSNRLKLCFNLSLLVFESALGATLVQVLPSTGTGPAGTWARLMLATLGAVTLGYIATDVVVARASGDPFGAVLRRTVPIGVAIAGSNGLLGLLTVAVVGTEPWATVLVAIAVLGGWYVLRMLDGQRRRADSLELLHDVTARLADAEDVAGLVAALLDEARTAARTETAIVVLDGEGCAFVLGEDDVVRTVELDPVALAAEPWASVPAAGVTRVSGTLAGVCVRQGLAARLTGDGGPCGLVVAANGTSHLLGIAEGDVRSFGTIVGSASVALQRCTLLVRLRHQALHDAVTGLPNRAGLHEWIQGPIGERRALGILIVDLDGFKDVNDALGHASGDALLQVLARRLSDPTLGDAYVARLGGDEFAVVIPDGTDWLGWAERLRAIVDRPVPLGGMTLHVTASIGIAIAPIDGDGAELLLQHADVALHLAKASPAGIARYDAARDPSSVARLAMLNDLRDAIENGELDVVFQPQADLRTGKVVAAEALVRWEHPVHGRVPPDVFVPLAEHAGLIRPLTRHVIRRALAARRRWADEGTDIRVSVNLSVRDLLDAQLPVEVTAELLASRTPPQSLILEITETSVMVDPVRTRAVLERLHELGICLAVDDFGTGYSSLAYLKVLPVDEVKIDRTFVADVATDESDAAIVRSVVDLGRNLGMRVVAEGVEDEAGWHRLRELGCDVAQGYLLCRPIPAGEVSAWLDQRREGAPLASPHERPAGADRGAVGAPDGALT